MNDHHIRLKKVELLKQEGLSFDEISEELKQLTKYPRFIDFMNYWYFDEKGLYRKDNLGGVKNGNFEPIFNPLTGKPDPVPPGGYRYSKIEIDRLLKITPCPIHFHKDGSLPVLKRYLHENLKQRPKSIMSDDQRPDYSLLAEFNLSFDNPKQMAFMERILSVGDSDSLVLDFFSGSSTTAHSVLKLNFRDNGNRKFIMVQIPEKIEPTNPDNQLTISDIGKERIRKAASKIKDELTTKIEFKKSELQKLFTGQQSIVPEEKKEALQQELETLEQKLLNTDFGFRVYRLDESNMQDVYYRPQDFTKDLLELTVDNIKPGRTPDDLLAQIMLDWGLPLSLKISSKDVLGKQVFSVADNSLYACFDNGIDEAFIKEIAKDKPLRIVFKDSGFADDTAKVNVKQLLKQLSPETEMKVI